MNEKIELRLDEVIEKGLENLSFSDLGTDESEAIIDDVAKLYRLKLDVVKTESEILEMDMNRKIELTNIEDKAKDRYIKIGMDSAGILLPLMFYGYWMMKGFRFEETGTYTSKTFMNLFNRFRPDKV